MKVTIDRAKCQGHAICHVFLPEVFGLNDEDGHAYVISDEAAARYAERTRKAALSCPENAIRISDK